MAIRKCQVSFVDQRGIRHSVAVYAGSVLEAAAAGLTQIRETEMIGDEGVEDLTVDIKTTTSHKVLLFKLKAWLQSSGRDPREAALKSKLRWSQPCATIKLIAKGANRRRIHERTLGV